MKRSEAIDPDRSRYPASRYLFFFLVVLAVTLFELMLANRKHGILTGGFLSTPLTGGWEISLFLASILTANLFVTVILFLALGTVFSRLKWPRPLCLSLSAFLAVLPLVVADVVGYELTRYMGDAISFYLLTRIAGGSITDMLANISGSQIMMLGIGVLCGFGAMFVSASIWSRYVRLHTIRVRQWVLIACMGSILAVCIALVGWQAKQSDELLDALRRFPSTRIILSMINQWSDRDKDGYGLFSNPQDPNNHDARIYPYAVDLPGNGIDENGLLGDHPKGDLAANAATQYPSVTFKRTPHFVLLVLESFRADLLFRSVDGVAVTPHLNRLARGGAYTQHGSSHNGYTIGGLNAIFSGLLTVGADQSSLIDDFNANGYLTACFSGENETFGDIEKTTGLNRVDHFYDARQDVERRSFPFASPASLTVPAEVVLERMRAFFDDTWDRSTPLFMYVNFQDLHFPYSHWATQPILEPRPISRGEIKPENQAHLEKTYLNGAANVDAAIGELRALLKAKLGDDVAMLVVADHGESLFDGGFLGHGHHLTDIQMTIPIVTHGFPAVVEDPMGQSEIRGLIRKALSVPAGIDQPPIAVKADSKRIFRYIGSIQRPSLIGWYRPDERTTIDLRNYRWRGGDDDWQPIAAGRPLPPDLVRLVRYWEALQLEQRGPA